MFLLSLLVPGAAMAAFGLTTNATDYTVDTGAGLVFKVRRMDTGSSTQSAGDIMSLVFNGVEYQDTSRGSQLNSGFDYLYTGVSAVAVSAAVVNTDYVKVTVVAGDLTHYYLARKGYPHITMATYFTSEPSTLGLCRYIVRIPASKLPNGPAPSDIRNNTDAIESADIFGMADGATRSKHYSNQRLKDWSSIGATGAGVGVWMVRSNHEGDSGGPFYRSLLNQCGDDQEITYIINYGEAQTEAFRTGILNGPYTLAFTNGGVPTAIDTAWVANMGLTGYVGASGRGTVTCSAISGRDARYSYTIGFANAAAQYWTDAAAGNGAFQMTGMLPGTYVMSVYKNELSVSTSSVSVAAGGTATLSPIAITTDPSSTVPLWRIGNWDGTPTEFLNGDRITTMHPSDVRLSSWSPGPYIVGASSPAAGMPCYHWKDVNGGQIVQFNLAPNQLVASTVRIGITSAYAGGRPRISVNSWTAANPSASSQPDSRTLTVGTYRGNNATYTFSVPTSALVAGTNTLTIVPISGSGSTGFLSAGYSLDCLDMYQGTARTVSIPAAPTTFTAIPSNGQVTLNWSASQAATGYTLQRSAAKGGPYSDLAAGVTSTAYTDIGLRNGSTYYYVVSASNTSGGGPNSLEASATPAGPASRAHLRFDENTGTTAVDSLANGWHGTLVNGPTWAAGRINGAVDLDGADDHVTLPAGIVAGLGDFTISAWVKLNSVSNWARIFDFGSGADRYMFLTPKNSATNVVRFAISSGGIGVEQKLDGSAALPSGTWTHVAVTLSGTAGTLYVNGTAVGTNAAMTTAPFSLGNTPQNYLGKSQFASDPYLNGLVDEVRIHGRALSAAEVASLAAPPAAPAGLSATAGASQVALSWNAVTGASQYSVMRAIANGGPYTVASGSVPGTAFTDSNLTNGTTYYYVVAAADGVAESASSAQVSATPVQTFAQWRAAAFPGQSDPVVAGPAADPDRDGYANLTEYFMARNPMLSEPGSAMSSALDGQGNVVLTFRMSKNLSGVTYVVQQSSDLNTWVNTGVQATVLGDQGTYYLMKATVPKGSQSKVFLRLSITGS